MPLPGNELGRSDAIADRLAEDERIVELAWPVEPHELRPEIGRRRPRTGRRSLQGARAPVEHRRGLQILVEGKGGLAAGALGHIGLADRDASPGMPAVDAVKFVLSEIWNSYIRVPCASAVAFRTVSVGRRVSSCSLSAGESIAGAVTFTTVGAVGAAGLSPPHPPAPSASTASAIDEAYNRVFNVLSPQDYGLTIRPKPWTAGSVRAARVSRAVTPAR